MTDNKDLGEEILGHLKLYRDLGVRWVRPGNGAAETPPPGGKRTKVQAAGGRKKRPRRQRR